MTELLRLEELSKFYTGKQSVVVGLDKLSIGFFRGEFVAVTGESGSGKSTLSHVLGGILPYESGELYFEGRPTSHYDSVDWERHRRDRVSFISQSYGILAGATVLTNVVSALRITGMEKKEAHRAAEEILRQVELWDLRRRRAAKLSSGQKQRLSIARALAKPAPILIADEPTGNLDPENSRKVMALLAQAARERLVILVTHEFSEAEPFATRHVVLQDGRVIMDAQLRPAREPLPMPQRQASGKKPLSPYVAALQQRSRPVWTALMVLFFALTAFGVFAFLGTFIVALDDAPTRKYDDSAFSNGAMERIVVATSDGSPMTQADYDRLLELEYVTALERNGYVSDVRYAYREGTDHVIRYTYLQWDANGNPIGDDHRRDVDGDGKLTNIVVSANAPFAQTVPLLSGEEPFLTAGRLPENIYEAVAVAKPDQIGRYATVHLSNPDRWGVNQLVTITVEIVGVTDWGRGLYFHEDLGRVCQQAARMDHNDKIYIFLPNENVGQEEFLSNPLVLDNFRISGAYTQVDGTVTVSFGNINGGDRIPLSLPRDVRLSDQEERMLQANTQQSAYVMDVSPENFQLLTVKDASEQVSLTISNYAYTDRVLAAAQAMGYAAVSPYRLGSTEQIPEKALERSQTLKLCGMALAAVVLLQIIVLRAMFSGQTGDFHLLSNMGLTCRTALGALGWQMAWLSAAGQLLAALGIWLCALGAVDRIVDVLVYLPVHLVVLLAGVHLAVSGIGALWVLLSLKKQVYPLAGRESDLEAEEAEAV